MACVLIVGGGITGLAAAVELVDKQADVTLWEGAEQLGGKIGTTAFGGVDHVDTGADAFLTRVPHGVAFAHRVGISDDMCGILARISLSRACKGTSPSGSAGAAASTSFGVNRGSAYTRQSVRRHEYALATTNHRIGARNASTSSNRWW